MKTKTDAKIDDLSRRIDALEDALDQVALKLFEQVELNAKLRELFEELTEKRK